MSCLPILLGKAVFQLHWCSSCTCATHRSCQVLKSDSRHFMLPSRSATTRYGWLGIVDSGTIPLHLSTPVLALYPAVMLVIICPRSPEMIMHAQLWASSSLLLSLPLFTSLQQLSFCPSRQTVPSSMAGIPEDSAAPACPEVWGPSRPSEAGASPTLAIKAVMIFFRYGRPGAGCSMPPDFNVQTDRQLASCCCRLPTELGSEAPGL